MVHYAYVTAVCGSIITFVIGTSLTWPSPVLPKLNETDTHVNPIGRPITDDEASWIGSLVALGAIFGPFISGFLAEKIGRKYTLLCLAVPFLVGYLTLAFAEIVELYYFARFIIGVAGGGVYVVLPMYTAEIAEDSNRGALGSIMSCLQTAGILFTFCVGPYTSIMAYNITLAVFPGIFLVLFFFVAVESPHYYVTKGNYEAALNSLHKLRGPDKSSKELDNIKASIEKSEEGSFTDLFRTKGLIKAFIISLVLLTFQQMSGISAILTYSQTIFAATSSDIEPEISSIILGVVLFVTSFITPLFVDKLGRKKLLLISAVGMVISEVPLGLYYYLQNRGDNVEDISWLPIIALVAFILTYNCAFGVIPWSVMGELFPANVKALASSLASTFCWCITFLITKVFQSIVDGIGMGPSFWLFAGFCFLAIFFVLFYVIETRGKSLQEIQELLES